MDLGQRTSQEQRARRTPGASLATMQCSGGRPQRPRPRLWILSQAGVPLRIASHCGSDSTLCDYLVEPVRYQAFMADEATRQRYWARSLIGWRNFGRATPDDAHLALAQLEAMGRSEIVVTQNVDRLHQAAGSARVIDLHGRLDLVRCMGCGQKIARNQLQEELTRLNASWLDLDAAAAPDGDLDARDFSTLIVPGLPILRGHPQARRRVLLRVRSPRLRQCCRGASLESRRHVGRWILFDGLFRVPFRADGSSGRNADRRRESWPHPCRPDVVVEGGRSL
jgi:hypothetical protein